VQSSARAIETSVRAASSPRFVAQSTETFAEQIAPWVAGVASVWFALAAAWGMFGPIPASA
jgi:hypothetical protein